jgi:hypothetical protein
MSNIYDDIRKVLNENLLANFPLVYTTSVVPIGIENQKFDTPKNTPHLRTWTEHISNKRISIGTAARLERKSGFFLVNIYVPEDTGTSILLKMTNAVVDIFTDKKLPLAACNYVITYSPEPKGEAKENGFYYLTVMIPFHTYGA